MMVESLASLLRPRKDPKGRSTMSVGSIGSSIRLHKNKRGSSQPTPRTSGRRASGDEDRESVVSATTGTATTLTSTGSIGTGARTAKGKNGHRRRRRVQFLFNEYDEVQVAVIESGLEFTDDEWDKCFMVNEDLRQNRKHAVRQAAMYGRKNQLYVDVLHSLLTSPLKATTPSPAGGARRIQESNREGIAAASPDAGVDLRPALVMDDDEVLRVIGECPERGLEHVMSRDALIMRHKQYVINSVLQRHEQLRRVGAHQGGQPGKVRDARADVLARFCVALTASSQDLAVRLAQADELQARAIYDEATSM